MQEMTAITQIQTRLRENGQPAAPWLAGKQNVSDVWQNLRMSQWGAQGLDEGLRRTPGGSASQTGNHFDQRRRQLQTRHLFNCEAAILSKR